MFEEISFSTQSAYSGIDSSLTCNLLIRVILKISTLMNLDEPILNLSCTFVMYKCSFEDRAELGFAFTLKILRGTYDGL